MAQQKRYKTIIADPPWRAAQLGSYGAVNHYNLLSTEKIKAMPVADLAEENSVCWLWCTTNSMREAFEVLEAWGFTHKSTFVWVKPNFTGLGRHLRNACEYVLVGTRGKIKPLCRNQVNWGFFQRQEHSHKPEEVFAIIRRVSPGPYLELFARRREPGIDVWGNEIDSDIDIPGYPVPNSPVTRKQKLKEAGDCA